jgi:hypothetical protein
MAALEPSTGSWSFRPVARAYVEFKPVCYWFLLSSLALLLVFAEYFEAALAVLAFFWLLFFLRGCFRRNK